MLTMNFKSVPETNNDKLLADLEAARKQLQPSQELVLKLLTHNEPPTPPANTNALRAAALNAQAKEQQSEDDLRKEQGRLEKERQDGIRAAQEAKKKTKMNYNKRLRQKSVNKSMMLRVQKIQRLIKKKNYRERKIAS